MYGRYTCYVVNDSAGDEHARKVVRNGRVRCTRVRTGIPLSLYSCAAKKVDLDAYSLEHVSRKNRPRLLPASTIAWSLLSYDYREVARIGHAQITESRRVCGGIRSSYPTASNVRVEEYRNQEARWTGGRA